MKQPDSKQTHVPSAELIAAIDHYRVASAARAASREVKPRGQKPVAAEVRRVATGKANER